MDPFVQFYFNWLNSRKSILDKNIQDTNYHTSSNNEINDQFNRIKGVNIKQDLNNNAYWDFKNNTIHTSSSSLIPHELVHTANDKYDKLTNTIQYSPQVQKIKQIITEQPNYFRSPNEIYPRLMYVRYKFHLDPNKPVTMEDLNYMENNGDQQSDELFKHTNRQEQLQLFNDVAYNSNNRNKNKYFG